MSLRQTLSTLDENINDDSLDNHALFTPDLEYYTPPTTITTMAVQETTMAYQPRTLSSSNKVRCTILPMFLPSSIMSNDINSMLVSGEDEPPLLLTNVPVQQLNTLQKARRLTNAYNTTFEFKQNYLHLINHQSDSFMSFIYHQLLVELSARWNINISIVDYNLARLHRCASRCFQLINKNKVRITTFTMEELPLALEFYLQIDVDMFYMKTCEFRQEKAIQRSIFCYDPPQVRYGMTSCYQPSCSYCHPIDARKLTGIQFQQKQNHQFINGYQAILNCPVTCETSNIIYVLTCPCGQADYIGYTSMSFRDCLAYHRDEGNRIMREFLIGPMTTNRILQGIKSEEEKENDGLLLYQHSARCSFAMQLFLDINPNFWCLVPMKSTETMLLEEDTTVSTLATTATPFVNKRLNASAKYLTEGVVRPPFGYMFSERQVNEQLDFFRNKNDQLQDFTAQKNIDLFQATIIAVLPDNSSTMLNQFVLSLFVTHAECKLNESGHLINENKHRDYCFRGTWCENLVRRTVSS